MREANITLGHPSNHIGRMDVCRINFINESVQSAGSDPTYVSL